jgi:heat shock protein HtpX
MRHFLSTFVSIGLLFSFLAIPIHSIFSLIGLPNYFTLIASVIAIMLLWWFSSSIYTFIFQKYYGAKWTALKELEQSRPSLMMFLSDLLHKENLEIRWIGVVDDDRPLAITYGTGGNDIHLIISSGVFHNLDEKEQQALVSHEVGHMVSGDFSVLSTAYLPAFLFYQASISFWNREKNQKLKISNFLQYLIGYGLYLLHLFFSFAVLMQSRVREEYADEYSGKKSNPNSLGSALSKISYICISSTGRKKSSNLMEISRPFSFIDYKMARALALAYMNKKENGNWVMVENLVMQDIYNPWPIFFEFTSTHPLPGRRLMLICNEAEKLHCEPFLDMERMFSARVESALIQLNFLQDFIIYTIARATPVIIILLLFIGYFYDKSSTIGVAIMLYGMGIALLSLYSFSYIKFKNETIKSQLEEKFVSPMKGRPLILDGVIREKSSLGLDLPEELIFADHSGELFIGPRSLLPMVISPYISASSLMKLKDKRVKVKGWYVRSRYPKLIIDEVITETEKLIGRQRSFDLGLACLVVSIGMILYMLPI